MRTIIKIAWAITLILAVNAEELRFLEDTAQQVKGLTKANQLCDTIGKVADTWGKIVSNFKSSSSSTIKQTLLGQGFTKFKGSGELLVKKGLRENKYEEWCSRFLNRMSAPADYRKKMFEILEEALWSDQTVWNKFDLLFNSGSPTNDNVKFTTLIINYDEDKGKVDIISSEMKAEFKLAPDVTIVTKQKSILGGIFDKTEDVEISKPKSLSQEELKSIFKFFEIIVFQTLAESFGYKIALP